VEDVTAGECSQLMLALNHLRAAIAILDAEGAPPHIAAHADLAASQIGKLESDDSGSERSPLN
jgi:hypothetical protein